MSASTEQLDELLTYCTDFAKLLLKDVGDFYPFGAVIGSDGKLTTVGGLDGSERPAPQDIYCLLVDRFKARALDGSIIAAALAANVDIPSKFKPPTPDGIRISLESSIFSRFIYIPYSVKKRGIFTKSFSVTFFEPISVEINHSFFVGSNA